MSVSEYITENYTNIQRWLKNVCKGENQHNFMDLVHDVMEIFLLHPKAEDVIERGEARWFIVRIALNQVRSKTSQYYYTYKPPFYEYIDNINEEVDTSYDMDEDNTIETLLMILDEMYNGKKKERYYALIILLYLTDTNFSSLSRRLNIPRTTIAKNYYEGIELLKEKYEYTIDKNRIDINNKSLKILTTQLLKNYGK